MLRSIVHPFFGRCPVALFACLPLLTVSACASAPLDSLPQRANPNAWQAVAHELRVRLDLSSSQLHLQDQVLLVGAAQCLDFELATPFVIESIELDGRPVQSDCSSSALLQSCRVCFPHSDTHDDAVPDAQSVMLLRYRAELSALPGRQRGTPYPVWLHANDRWYARVGEGATRFAMELELPEGFDACAPGRRMASTSPSHREILRFESHEAHMGASLAMGRWSKREQSSPSLTLRTLLSERSSARADELLSSSASILHRLVGMYGPVPHPELSIVELPQASLIASPGCIFVSSAWLEQQPLDLAGLTHELLHSWFGLSVFASFGGNWVEGLVTYLAEHEHAAALSSEHARALRKRLLREHQRFVHGKRDHPLTLFKWGQDRASQSLGYARAAMIFHMLRRELGDADFYAALRLLAVQRRFRSTSWDELLLNFEDVSGARLANFSIQWWERSGAPRLELADVAQSTTGGELQPHRLDFDVLQSEPSYRLLLPVRVDLPLQTSYSTLVELPAQRRSSFSLEIPARASGLRLDPEYALLRMLNDDELESTLADVLGESSALLALHPGLSDSAIESVELAVAAGLLPLSMANSFDEALHRDGFTVLFLSREHRAELEQRLDDELSALLDEFQTLSDAHTLVAAVRPSENSQVLAVFLGEGTSAYELLLVLASHMGWSAVLLDPELQLERRLRWPSGAASLTWSASP